MAMPGGPPIGRFNKLRLIPVGTHIIKASISSMIIILNIKAYLEDFPVLADIQLILGKCPIESRVLSVIVGKVPSPNAYM